MKKMTFIIIVLMVTLLTSFSSAIAGESEVLKALSTINRNLESGLSYSKYCELLAKATAEIDKLLEGGESENECFIEAVKGCHRLYNVAKEHWEEMREHKRKSNKHRIMAESQPEDLKENYIEQAESEDNLAKLAKDRILDDWKKALSQLDKAYRCIR